MNVYIYFTLLAFLTIFGLITVMIRNLLKAAIGLAVTSAILTIVMFLLGAWLAAVFELSVCAGLITVIFISTINMTKPQTLEEDKAKRKQRLKRFIFLPVILVAVFCLLLYLKNKGLMNFNSAALTPADSSQNLSVSDAIWNKRQFDVLGQIIIILSGVFGVIVLFKGSKEK
jgi:NADH-quinone oxidoreductase subunit J